MKNDLLEKYQSKLLQEIKEREQQLKKIETIMAQCTNFLSENKDYVTADKEADILTKTMITIEKLNNFIETNTKDIENIVISQTALKQVVSISNDTVIETLDKDIKQIHESSQKINNQIEEIYKPLHVFMQMEIDCPYCKIGTTRCAICNGTNKIKIESAYEKKSQDIYSENNTLAVHVKEPFIEVELNKELSDKLKNEVLNEYTENNTFSNDVHKNENTNIKTKFVLSRN